MTPTLTIPDHHREPSPQTHHEGSATTLRVTWHRVRWLLAVTLCLSAIHTLLGQDGDLRLGIAFAVGLLSFAALGGSALLWHTLRQRPATPDLGTRLAWIAIALASGVFVALVTVLR